ncbi:MAG TPA: ABC transporter permease [Ilumatobacteraceae bacterium]
MNQSLDATAQPGTDPAADRGAPSEGAFAPAGSQRRTFSVVMLTIAPALGIVLFLAAWQFVVLFFHIPKYELPRASDILRGLKDDPGFYIRNSRTTLWEALVGFTIALVAGIVGATVMAHSRFVERAVGPLAVFLQVTPIIAYAPAMVIWLGFGFRPIVVITSIVCLVPFLINGVTGLRAVDPNLLELAHSVDASKLEIFIQLRLPTALPYLFSAARIAVGLALIGSVLAEFFAGVSSGLGFSVKIALNRNLALQAWGTVYTLAIAGALATVLISAIERVVLRWHHTQRA